MDTPELTCVVCGQEGLKFPRHLAENESMDSAARTCPRCRAIYCVFCLQKLPAHKDGYAYKCAKCGKYSIIEMAGKSDILYKSSAESSEKRYG